MRLIHTTIKDENGDDLPVRVEYEYFRASRGHCDKYGAPEEPDTPAEVNIITIYNEITDEEIKLKDDDERLLKLCGDIMQTLFDNES